MDRDSVGASISIVRSILIMLVLMGAATADPLERFIAAAREKHGASGEKAAVFLSEHMPEHDRASLAADFLTTNLDLAFQARREFPWAAQVPEEIFLNDVLPYAVFDETRDSWRADFLKMARPIVKDARTASEAAQALNRDFFKRINVHYHTGRKAPNQSPAESMKTGMASCTGLSIILIDACRAVGIPARAVGTPMWTNGRGNHTWVEIWDGGWHFTGADESDPRGLNRGWFTDDAAQAKADVAQHAIYATSWKKAGLAFPLPWARENHDVAAVNVTARYAEPTAGSNVARLGVRLFGTKGGERIVARVFVSADSRSMPAGAETKAGTADLNDMPRFELRPGVRGRLLFSVGNETRQLAFGPLSEGETTVDAVWQNLTKCSAAISAISTWLAIPAAERPADTPVLAAALTREDSAQALKLLGGDWLKRLAVERKEEMQNQSIALGGKTLRWLEKTFGEAPADGRSLWISLHGGGGAPAAVNDGQWRNQIHLYEPAEGIYIAPRAPTDTWNLWHEGHIDPMFQRLIENFAVLRGVNPDRIYLMGYSAGGTASGSSRRAWRIASRRLR